MQAEPRGRSIRPVALAVAVAALIAAFIIGAAIVGPSRLDSDVAATPRSDPEPTQGVDPWGPLAVERSQGVIMHAGIGGRLRIEETCVVLIAPPEAEILIVWPSDRTAWDNIAGTITFANTDGSRMTLRDGMSLRFSGGGFAEAESDISIEEWLDLRTWVNPPAESCMPAEAWVLGDVVEAE